MGRVLLFSLKLAVLVGLAYWLAETPGTVSIEWLGYRLDTSVGVLIFVVVLVALTVAAIYRFWRFLLRSPRDLNASVKAGRRRRGYRALTQGMVAVAAGEREEAARWARKADALLDEPPLTMLLSAQAAQLSGDEAAARRYFTAMLDDDDTRFLGLRGLLTQALREGDNTRALELAREAHGLRPRTPWVLQSLFDLTERGGDLEAAESALRESLRARVLPKAEATRKRAVVLLERADTARAAGDSTNAIAAANAAALSHAREAHKLAPDLIPASALLAELLLEGGEARKAVKVLEEAWARSPHPDLAALYLKARPSDDSLERLKTLGRLVARNKDHAESHLARARAALEARLWGETRRHLDAATGPGGLDAGQPREAVCRLMAELEEAERADVDLAHSWLTRAATAPPDPLWVCADCGAGAEGWSARCGNCASFDALAWTAPPRVTATHEIAAPLAAPADRVGLPALTAPQASEKEEAPAPPA